MKKAKEVAGMKCPIRVHPERLEELDSYKLDIHWNWLSAWKYHVGLIV